MTGAAEQIVGRNVEEALDLSGVEIDRSARESAPAMVMMVGDQLGRNGRARSRLSILARITEIRDDRA